ncbi:MULTISPECIES: ATP-binding protein [Burkholderia]|uniref:ATP-binding protein n=1 Tax=Burkholderia TaxID=32008 RepID=UPI001929EC28|nr:ATP-binding protein [Burkholderia cenocepacia]MBL3961194.1 ATP-binding protein [Burkholderia sp. KCJ3K979]MCW3610777.1 ATP-binding protein [Burkholderia cenocepacia]MCW5191792.1 ATP-binding protein [Burkholderia cenocepacia]
MAFELPERIDPRHCIVTRQYAVYTPPMHEMIAQIGDWIDQQRPGGYIYGASRLGKTRCVQWYLASVLEERFKAVLPLVVWNRRADSHTSEAGFWHQILLASRFEFANPLKPPRKAEAMYLCRQRFIAIANNSERNYLVLLIDEAQDLTLREWKWLVGLQNDLDYEGYLLSVFSVGSHQLSYHHEYMASTGNAHVAARFMAAHARFHGLRSCSELGYVMNGYDIDSEWPPGSGISYLEYFAPADFAAGRRLTDSAGDLWKALTELSPDAARRHIEFPMQHVARATEAMLFRLSRGEDWNEVTSYESWLNELARANFSDHMRIISTGT